MSDTSQTTVRCQCGKTYFADCRLGADCVAPTIERATQTTAGEADAQDWQAADLVERHLGVFLRWVAQLGPNYAAANNARRAAEAMVRIAYAEGKCIGFQEGENAGRSL